MGKEKGKKKALQQQLNITYECNRSCGELITELNK